MTELKGNQKRGAAGKFAPNPVARPHRSLKNLTPAEVAESHLKWGEDDLEIRKPIPVPPLKATDITYSRGEYVIHTEVDVNGVTFQGKYTINKFGVTESWFEPKDADLETVFDDEDNIVCRSRKTGEKTVIAYCDDFNEFRTKTREEAEYIIERIEQKAEDARANSIYSWVNR